MRVNVYAEEMTDLSREVERIAEKYSGGIVHRDSFRVALLELLPLARAAAMSDVMEVAKDYEGQINAADFQAKYKIHDLMQAISHLAQPEQTTDAPAQAVTEVDHLSNFLEHIEKHGLETEEQLAASVNLNAAFQCKKCGCLWRQHADRTWSLYDAAQKPEKCCDNSEDFLSAIQQVAAPAQDGAPSAGGAEIADMISHMDLHLTEHDLRHAGMALRLAWSPVKQHYESKLESLAAEVDKWHGYTLSHIASKNPWVKNYLDNLSQLAERAEAEAADLRSTLEYERDRNRQKVLAARKDADELWARLAGVEEKS